jgi:hypothetical protein
LSQKPLMQRLLQQSVSVLLALRAPLQQVPFSQRPLQHGSPAAQEPLSWRQRAQKLLPENTPQMPLQHSLSAVQKPVLPSLFGVQHLPLAQTVPLQHWVSGVQVPPFDTH